MDVERITIDRKEARELYRQYKAHQHYSDPLDHEIQRAYQLIAQGRMVIRALESVKVAGVFADGPNAGLPKLAIVRADVPQCFYRIRPDGSAYMSARNTQYRRSNEKRGTFFDWGPGTFSPKPSRWEAYVAQTPLVPVHLRPKRGVENYHILFEAEWQRIVPKDPMLLRRISKGDMWLVVAAWDLTEVERTALATRLNG